MQSQNESSTWPKASIFFWGSFGSNDPAGRAYHRSCLIALGGMLAWLAIEKFVPLRVVRRDLWSASPLIITLGIGYIAFAFRRYLLSLDELARRLQFEAIAWTYLTLLPFALGFAALSRVEHWYFSPAWPLLGWFVLAEGMRAGWLYLGTRKY